MRVFGGNQTAALRPLASTRKPCRFLAAVLLAVGSIVGTALTEPVPPAQAQSTCAAPTNFRVTGTTATTVSVAWNAVTGATSYEVWYAIAPSTPSAVYASGFTGTTATLYSLVTGTTYTFAVRAICAGGPSGLSNTVTATPGGSTTTTCQPPLNLRVTATNPAAQTVDLAWDPPNGPTPDSYSAYVSQTSGGPYSLWAQGLPGPTTARLFSLGSTDWYIVVRSVCGGTESGNSNEVRRSGGTVPTTTTTTTTTSTTTPPNTCTINPADGQAAITAAVNSCPDGSTIVFPANRTYHQTARIEVKDRRNLVIDGNGSTFITSSNGAVTKSIDPNWLVLRGFNITLKNMTTVGDFTAYEGQPRSLARISPDPEFTEAQMGFGLYGVDTVKLLDVKSYNQWGDGATTGPDMYVDGSSPDYTRNVVIDNMYVDTVGRACWAPTSGDNVTIEDSTCRDAWYGGLDAELDNLDQPLRGHRYLRNTFDGFTNYGINVPVAGNPGTTRDIEIRGNRFLTRVDQICAPLIGVGGWPTNPNVFQNVTVADNHITLAHGPAIALDHVSGGSVTGNTINIEDNAGCNYPNPVQPIKVTNSTNVTVGPNTVT